MGAPTPLIDGLGNRTGRLQQLIGPTYLLSPNISAVGAAYSLEAARYRAVSKE